MESSPLDELLSSLSDAFELGSAVRPAAVRVGPGLAATGRPGLSPDAPGWSGVPAKGLNTRLASPARMCTSGSRGPDSGTSASSTSGRAGTGRRCRPRER